MTERKATREAYGQALAELGHHYDFVVLDADLAEATKTGIFKKEFPDRFFDCGIAEGNMITVAAGIATTGRIPFVSSFAMFAAGRAYEQVRNAIGYPHLNVKIGATHAGISVGEDGATHQCNEDIALMRTIPGMVIINPVDAVEARAAVEAALNHQGPVYLRFGRFAVPVFNDAQTYHFELGRGVVMAPGTDVTVFATGLMVEQAMLAREQLQSERIQAKIVNIHTIKPIDTELIIQCAKDTGAVVTAEEHNIIGGLGSAVAEVLAEHCPVPMARVGIADQYGRSGKVQPLLEYYGLTAKDICDKVHAVLSQKKG